jgi:ribonuclease E
MSKELFVSSTPHETKVAIVEEDQLSEIYFERENEYTLAGSIYKGRVTRVLPGMQSAFVNIGLERDAFLYVSDFLLEEEEDAEVMEQVTPRASLEAPEESHARQDFQSEPIEAQEVFPAVEDSQPEASGVAEPPVEKAGEESEREGARKWRGRRRRGRGRDRFPERGDRGGREDREQPTAEVPPEQLPEPAPAHESLVLPGESISKYQPPTPVQPAAQVSSQPATRPTVRPSTEYSLDSSQFSPDSMVLPGESIARYRNEKNVAPAVEEGAASSPSTLTETASERNRQETAHPLEESFHERAWEHAQRVEAHQAGPFIASEEQQQQPVQEAQKEAVEKMDVAGGFTGEAPTEAPRQEEPVPPATRAETQRESVETPAQASPSWQVSGSGVVEEEEIEEEELDLPDFDEEHLELADYEELEEEELAPADDQMMPFGSELTEAVRDAHINERATGEYEGEGLEGGPDFEDEDRSVSRAEHAIVRAEGDSELEGEEEEEGEDIDVAEESEDLEGTRAELRASNATAGYQQRTERRPDRRGRRVGRRMRGRPRQYVQRQLPAISDLLKEGQEILVQIAKEPIAKKGARITSHIALPGRFLVYMPTVHHTGVSRKIASEEERHRLKRIVLSERGEAHGGFIVRTAAAGANEEDLRADIRFLIHLWNEIRGRAEKSKAPALIYHDLNLVERILRDQVTVSFSSIWVDTEQEYERILRFVSRFQPSLVKRVKLYTKDTPLFEQFNISDEINKSLKSKVWLKSGGYIVINQTEALVAIDVNTGKYVGRTARLEDTIVKTNIDAIREIVRQIRLRDLGGIIVIDFIDMDERKNRHKVMQALEEALKADRAPSKVLQFNDFGLVAITRKRVKQSLERTLGQPCPVCTGTGMIKSVTTICNEIYVEMRKMMRHFERDIVLRVHPDVAKGLKTGNGRWLQEMEELTKQSILVKSDPLLHPEQFDIQ